MMNRKRPTDAFTLVELLVVIAIIALLAALLMPVVQQAVTAGQGAVCRANSRQIGQAMFMHARDFDDYLPFHGDPVAHGRPASTWGSNPANGTQWDVQLMPYLGMESWPWGVGEPPAELGLRPTVFYCPAVKPAFTDNRPNRFVWSLSYGYNQRVGQNFRGSRSLALLQDPVSTLLIMDNVHHQSDPWNQHSGWLGRADQSTNRYTENSLLTRGLFAYRHNRHTHILFADGHVDARGQGPGGYPAAIRMGNGYPLYPSP